MFRRRLEAWQARGWGHMQADVQIIKVLQSVRRMCDIVCKQLRMTPAMEPSGR
jgi:hypothetical protein